MANTRRDRLKKSSSSSAKRHNRYKLLKTQTVKMRWILSLLCIVLICVCQLPALAQEVDTATTISEAQWQHGHEIAKKAVVAAKKGNFNQSERYWSELITEFPENPAVWSNRGNIRVAQYKLDEAIADFDRAIQLAPEQPDPYLNRGVALEGKGHYQEALADYDRVIAINPQDAMAYNNRGNAMAAQQRWLEALTNYQKAAEIAPDFAIARANA
ncbi:MAG: tetratricopeptide repeat protein, partial [Xenococcaceae cyanobacterium]